MSVRCRKPQHPLEEDVMSGCHSKSLQRNEKSGWDRETWNPFKRDGKEEREYEVFQ